MKRLLSEVRRYVRSAPLTYAWLVVLLATTVVQHSLSDRLLRSLLQSTSTNLHHLASDPIRVLINSLLWIDGRYWWPYLVIFTVFLAPAFVVGIAGVPSTGSPGAGDGSIWPRCCSSRPVESPFVRTSRRSGTSARCFSDWPATR